MSYCVPSFLYRAAITASASIGLLLFSCGVATITTQKASSSTAVIQRPDKIVVYDFAVTAENITQNQGPLQKAYRALTKDEDQQDADRFATGQEAAYDMSEDLVKATAGARI
jgi:hypothetical protein